MCDSSSRMGRRHRRRILHDEKECRLHLCTSGVSIRDRRATGGVDSRFCVVGTVGVIQRVGKRNAVGISARELRRLYTWRRRVTGGVCSRVGSRTAFSLGGRYFVVGSQALYEVEVGARDARV